MKVVPCEPEHLRRVRARAEQAGEVTDELAELLPADVLRHLARTVLNDAGEPVACMGVYPVLPKVATAWAVISEEATAHGALLSIVAKRGLAQVAKSGVFRRIDTLVRHDFTVAGEWASDLGFYKEGSKQNYGLGGDTIYDEWVILLDPIEVA